jgi:hypothetical protein
MDECFDIIFIANRLRQVTLLRYHLKEKLSTPPRSALRSRPNYLPRY